MSGLLVAYVATCVLALVIIGVLCWHVHKAGAEVVRIQKASEAVTQLADARALRAEDKLRDAQRRSPGELVIWAGTHREGYLFVRHNLSRPGVKILTDPRNARGLSVHTVLVVGTAGERDNAEMQAVLLLAGRRVGDGAPLFVDLRETR